MVGRLPHLWWPPVAATCVGGVRGCVGVETEARATGRLPPRPVRSVSSAGRRRVGALRGAPGRSPLPSPTAGPGAGPAWSRGSPRVRPPRQPRAPRLRPSGGARTAAACILDPAVRRPRKPATRRNTGPPRCRRHTGVPGRWGLCWLHSPRTVWVTSLPSCPIPTRRSESESAAWPAPSLAVGWGGLRSPHRRLPPSRPSAGSEGGSGASCARHRLPASDWAFPVRAPRGEGVPGTARAARRARGSRPGPGPRGPRPWMACGRTCRNAGPSGPACPLAPAAAAVWRPRRPPVPTAVGVGGARLSLSSPPVVARGMARNVVT